MNRFEQISKASFSKSNQSRPTKKAKQTSDTRKSQKKVKSPATKIPRQLLEAWEQCLIANGRFPKGTKKNEENSFKLIRKLILGESDSIYQVNEACTKGELHKMQALLRTKKGLISFLLSGHLDQLLNSYQLVERVGRKWKWKQLFQHFDSFEISDWMSGTGACADVWLHLLLQSKASQDRINIKLIDDNQMLLDGAVQILEKIAPRATINRYSRASIMEIKTGNAKELKLHSLGFAGPKLKYDKKTLKTFLNQLKLDLSQQQASIVSLLDIPCAEAARELMHLRDEIVGMGFQAIYPCPAAVDTCPMLLQAKDWCYSEFDYEPTFLQKSLQKELRISQPLAKSSAFLFASPKALEISSPSASTARVVGRPRLKSKNNTANTDDFQYLMCTEKGLDKFPSSMTKTRIARRGWDMHIETSR